MPVRVCLQLQLRGYLEVDLLRQLLGLAVGGAGVAAGGERQEGVAHGAAAGLAAEVQGPGGKHGRLHGEDGWKVVKKKNNNVPPSHLYICHRQRRGSNVAVGKLWSEGRMGLVKIFILAI